MSTDLMPLDGEIAAIEQTMRRDFALYSGDVQLQGRYRALLDAREAGGETRSASVPGTERREIEKLMADPGSAYWKGPQSAELQARYLEIVAADDGQAPLAEGMPPPLLRLPKNASETDLAVARVAYDVLRSLPSATRGEFERSFNALPATVLAACRAELASAEPWSAPVGQQDVQRFATQPEGAAMVEEWGPAAPMKLGRLRGRLQRWLGRLTPADQDAASAWLDSLDPDTTQALYRAVAA